MTQDELVSWQDEVVICDEPPGAHGVIVLACGALDRATIRLQMARMDDKSRARGPASVSAFSRFQGYFRSSCCPVHEPRTLRILPRSTAPLLAAATEPSTSFATASNLAVAPSNAAQFL